MHVIDCVVAVAGFLLALLSAIGLSLLFAIRRLLAPVEKGSVGFFHPFADGGGGGERVLWCAVRAIQSTSPHARIFIYVRQGVTPDALAQDALSRFGIKLERPVEVVQLTRSHLLLPERYPRLTLLLQFAGSGVLAWEALRRRVPEVFIDTTGWAAAYPLARLAGCRVAAYVHYPTISWDMIRRVAGRQAMYNNDARIAGSALSSAAKLAYYRAFALLYGFCGAFPHAVMVNSTWTLNHIRQLWWRSRHRPPALVYPPCDTEALRRLPLDRKLKKLYLIAVAQFRPEKNHGLLLRSYALALEQAGSDAAGEAVRMSRLYVVGSCRGTDDEARLHKLQADADALGLGERVEWYVNVSHAQLISLLGGAVGGVHCMQQEHFGISVVEYMAAGVVPIAHNSGGPCSDIVVAEDTPQGPQPTGYLAATEAEYAAAMTEVLAMGQVERMALAGRAQRRSAAFSTDRFTQDFSAIVRPLLPR